jgi:hypothetical protein
VRGSLLTGQRPERSKPANELVLAAPVGHERLGCQQAADLVENSRDMHIQVCVDTARHSASWFYDDGHRHPYLPLVKGWRALTPTVQCALFNPLEQDEQSHHRCG